MDMLSSLMNRVSCLVLSEKGSLRARVHGLPLSESSTCVSRNMLVYRKLLVTCSKRHIFSIRVAPPLISDPYEITLVLAFEPRCVVDVMLNGYSVEQVVTLARRANG